MPCTFSLKTTLHTRKAADAAFKDNKNCLKNKGSWILVKQSTLLFADSFFHPIIRNAFISDVKVIERNIKGRIRFGCIRIKPEGAGHALGDDAVTGNQAGFDIAKHGIGAPQQMILFSV